MTEVKTRKEVIEAAQLTSQEKRSLDLLFKKAMTHLRIRSLTAAIKFMSVERLEWTTSSLIPTAAIVQFSKKAAPRIYINILFLDELKRLSEETSLPVEKFIADVITHELLHFLLRHLVSGDKRVKHPQLANAVFDIFINHILATLKLSDFMEHFYPSTEFGRMRIIDENAPQLTFKWSEDKDTFPTLFLNPGATRVHAKHTKAYEKIQRLEWSVKQIENYLVSNMPKPDSGDTVLYVGSHGELSEGEGEEVSALPKNIRKEAEEVLREFFTKDKSGGLKHSKFGDLFEEHLKVEKTKDPEVDEVFLKAMIQDNRGYMLRNMGVYATDRLRQTVFPSFSDKRDLVLVSAGQNPVYFSQEVNVNRGRVVIYTDVSGSMEGIKELTYGLMIGLEQEYEVDLYLFSTELNPLSKQDLKAGKVETTGGTDFNVWAEHMLEKDYDKVLVITDGYGDIAQHNLDQMRENRSELYVVYTKEHMTEALDEFTKASCVLNSDRMYR